MFGAGSRLHQNTKMYHFDFAGGLGRVVGRRQSGQLVRVRVRRADEQSGRANGCHQGDTNGL